MEWNLCLIGLLGAAVAVVDTLFALAQVGWFRLLYIGTAVLVCAAALSYFSYVFALHARFENSLAGHVKNALILAFVAPGQTLKICLAFSVPVLCALYLPWGAVVRVGFVFLLLGVSAPAYFAARIQRKLFARFTPEGGA